PRTPGDRVLVDVRGQGLSRRLLERLRGREIRKALREVDGPVQVGEPRHLADDRLREPRGLGGGSGNLHEGPAVAVASGRAATSVMSGGNGRERSTWPASVLADCPSIRIWTRLIAG